MKLGFGVKNDNVVVRPLQIVSGPDGAIVAVNCDNTVKFVVTTLSHPLAAVKVSV